MIELLARILQQRGTDLDELAKAVGVTRARLEGMLSGRQRFPSDIFVAICRTEHLSMTKLQEEAGEYGR